jgi:acetylornithine deacetylase/succinyl-diaminopimelate desuccinylase-like protein
MKVQKIIIALILSMCCPLMIDGQHLDLSNINRSLNQMMPEMIKEHQSLVSIPNDSNYPKDMDVNVEWIKNAYEKRGYKVSVLKTETIPVIFCEYEVSKDLPTILFYIHYDGQPVDPSEWDQDDPFNPVIRNETGALVSYENITQWNDDWRIYARAAADDKAPIMMMLYAMDLMKHHDLDPAYNIKIVMDGEEERGSAGLKYSLNEYRSYYDADKLIIMDGPAHPTNDPTLTFGCRGIASATLTVYGPRTSQHSGHYGNYAPNPGFLASNLLASMKDVNGRVLIDGFYDNVKMTPEVLKILNEVPDDPKMINKVIGIAQPDKVGDSYQESLQYPSLNIRGMASGWIGKQTRTIVPDRTIVQLGIRLVMETDGNEMLDLVRRHIERQGFTVLDREPTEEERLTIPRLARFMGRHATNAFRTDIDSEMGQWLSTALEKVHGKKPIRIRTMGGTIPVTPMIKELDIPAVIVPMVNMDNNQHSPNENIRVGNLRTGVLTCMGILTETISY